MEELTETFEYRNRIEQELMLHEHELKLKNLDDSISIQSRHLNEVVCQVSEFKMIVNEIHSTNKILTNQPHSIIRNLFPIATLITRDLLGLILMTKK